MNAEGFFARRFAILRRKGLLSAGSVLYFLDYKSAGITQNGNITAGFFILQDKKESEENLFWLQLINTEANLALYNKSTNIVVTSYRHNLDNLIFDLKKETFAPASQLYFQVRMIPRRQKWTPV